MPEEPPLLESLAPDIEQQLARFRKHPLIMGGDLRINALRWLLVFQQRGNYDRRRNPDLTTKQIYFEFYEYSLHEKLSGEVSKKGKGAEQIEETITARVKKLFGDLADALRDYYAGPGVDDPIHITLQRGQGGRFEPEIELRAVAHVPGGQPSSDVLRRLQRGPVHAYHLTQDDEGKPMWSYTMLTFRPGKSEGTLVARAAYLPKAGATPADREKHMYDSEASLDHAHLVVRTFRADADVAIRLFPSAGVHNLPWCGIEAITNTWHHNPASSICIMNDCELDCARGAVDGEPICDPQVMKALEGEWDKGAGKIGLKRLPSPEQFPDLEGVVDRIISDTNFVTGTEALAADGTDIWVASPDLSNVGDGTSPFSETVRKVVRENAGRSVNYSYVCPQLADGDSRLENLQECFIGTPGKLRVHQIPLERFQEITLVRSHFVSFNPHDGRPEVYMQLPLPQSEKGWVRLSRTDAGRVLSKIKRLMAEYHVENTAI